MAAAGFLPSLSARWMLPAVSAQEVFKLPHELHAALLQNIRQQFPIMRR